MFISPLCHGDGLQGAVGFFFPPFRYTLSWIPCVKMPNLSEQKLPNLSERYRSDCARSR